MIEAASTFKHASQRLHATRSLGALFQALTADDLGGGPVAEAVGIRLA